MPSRAILPVALLVLAVPLAAADAPSPRPLAALQQCRTLTDATARLACYDGAVDALTAATASGEVQVVDRQEVRRTRKGLFGFTLPRIGFLSSRPGSAEDAADEARLETTITASRSIGYGKYRITLDSGAVWETQEASGGMTDPDPGTQGAARKG